MEYERALLRSLDLMAHAEAVCLTTLDQEGWPHTRAMLNLRNKEIYHDLIPVFSSHNRDLTLYFTTNTSSGKIIQITGNNRASAYFCIPSAWQGLMLGGEISIITDPVIKGKIWQNGWTMYYPGGPLDPDYAILRISPRIAKYYEYLDSCTWNPGQV